MHRVFVLRAYGDFIIFLQAILQSKEKQQYQIIASAHLAPLYGALSKHLSLENINIEFVSFGIQKTLLRFFTNKYMLSLGCFREINTLKKYLKKNPNKDGIDYIEQDKKITWLNIFTGHSFQFILGKQNVYTSYAAFFKIVNIEQPIATVNTSISKKVVLFPDSRLPAKQVPAKNLHAIVAELAAMGYSASPAYFKKAPSSVGLIYEDFDGLIKLIKEADLIIGADSLPIHIANLFNKPHYILYPKGFTQLFMTPYAQLNNRFGTFDAYNFSFLAI